MAQQSKRDYKYSTGEIAQQALQDLWALCWWIWSPLQGNGQN
jgi:hypothetical protein